MKSFNDLLKKSIIKTKLIENAFCEVSGHQFLVLFNPPFNLNTNGINCKRKRFESQLRENSLNNSKNTNKWKTFGTINESINKKCCAKDHISELSFRQRKEIFNYYQLMETRD